MLIDFREAVRKYGIKIDGAIQAGGHHGQEIDLLLELGAKGVVVFEPCQKAFTVLKEKYSHYANVYLHKFALGNEERVMTMYTETANTGQSNSLLKPAKHLEQHPNIFFNGTEDVNVVRLDSFGYSYNTMVLDTQGFEKHVLMGATNTLRHVDYIYTEINFTNIYEDCVLVDELDEILSDYKRVETYRVGGWGDALYIAKKLLK